MTKHQRGNKEAKKPKKAPQVVAPLSPGEALAKPTKAPPSSPSRPR